MKFGRNIPSTVKSKIYSQNDLTDIIEVPEKEVTIVQNFQLDQIAPQSESQQSQM